MNKAQGLCLGGRWVKNDDVFEVRSPFDDSLVTEVSRATREQTQEAAASAVEGFKVTSRLSSFERARILEGTSAAITARAEQLARTMSLESGKTIRDSKVEVARAANTFKVAAEEAKRIGGEYLPLDWIEQSAGRFGITKRFPLGSVLGVTPFNFPLNLVAHKVAPAIAAGNSIVIKPASSTPLCALALAEMLLGAGLPGAAISVLPCPGSLAEPMVSSDSFKLFTFTGSAEVGWRLKGLAGKKRVTLELGGNAAVIIDRDVPLGPVVDKCVRGSFSNAGQICISVQRIYVHEDLYESFLELFVSRTKSLVLGDPADEKTDVGPLIDLASAEKTEAWVNEARSDGAKALTGAVRRGTMYEPTILVDVRPDMKVSCAEVFAPVVTVSPFCAMEEALEQVNNSSYGLQAGIFTGILAHALQAFERLEVGGVVLNDVPTYRVDHMPYGGVKDSGFGREGLRYAIEEMTELKLLAINSRG
jgi:acyl-CoA reductase-like NAD-dependent aldehyde dehydrogenase